MYFPCYFSVSTINHRAYKTRSSFFYDKCKVKLEYNSLNMFIQMLNSSTCIPYVCILAFSSVLKLKNFKLISTSIFDFSVCGCVGQWYILSLKLVIKLNLWLLWVTNHDRNEIRKVANCTSFLSWSLGFHPCVCHLWSKSSQESRLRQSEHVTTLLKTFNGFPTPVKINVLIRAHTILSPLPFPLHYRHLLFSATPNRLGTKLFGKGRGKKEWITFQ